MKKKCLYGLTSILFLAITTNATTFSSYIENKKGLSAFESKNYEKALEQFGKSLEKKGDEGSLLYNIANVYSQSDQSEKAKKTYLSAINKLKGNKKANAYYNLGNLHFNEQNYQEAINAYIESLKINPSDQNSKQNLELALAYLELQKQNEKQQNKEEEKKNDQKNDQKKEKQKSKKDKEQQAKKEENAEKKQAKNFLNTLNKDEKEALKKYKHQQPLEINSDYDW